MKRNSMCNAFLYVLIKKNKYLCKNSILFVFLWKKSSWITWLLTQMKNPAFLCIMTYIYPSLELNVRGIHGTVPKMFIFHLKHWGKCNCSDDQSSKHSRFNKFPWVFETLSDVHSDYELVVVYQILPVCFLFH